MLSKTTKSWIFILTLSTLSACRDNDDGSGLPSSDLTPPVISLNGSASEQHEAGMLYSDAGATASDDVDGVITANVLVSGSVDVNMLGSYTLTYKVTDSSGNQAASVTRTVTVVDTTAPVLSLNDSATFTLEVGDTYVESGATAIDSLEGDISDDIQISSNVDTNAVGTYIISYNVTDASGNEASLTRSVLVEDTTAPLITLVGAASITIELGDTYIDSGAAATDNLDGDVSANILSTGSVNTNTIGTYNIEYNVIDSSANAAITVTRTVLVEDTTPPIILSTSPESDTVNIALDTEISVLFNETIATNLIDASVFTLTDSHNNNVSGTINVNPNGTTLSFIPDAALSESTLYSVSISTAISDLQLNNLTNAVSWQFTTVGTDNSALPELINLPGSPVFMPAMAVSESGKAAAIWGQNNVLNINRYNPESGWSGAQQVSPTDAYPEMEDYKVAINDNGDVVVIWVGFDSRNLTNILSARVYSETNGWSDAYTIDDREGYSDEPELAMDNDGNTMVIWRFAGNSASDRGIYVSVYNKNNAEWGLNLPLAETESGDLQSPHIAMNSVNQAMAVWVEDGTNLVSTFYDLNSVTNMLEWSPNTSIDVGADSTGVNFPKVSINEAGDAVATWGQQSAYNPSGDIYANSFSATLGWSGALALETMIEGEARYPQVKMNETHAVVVWTEYDGLVYSVYSNILALQDQWQGPSLVEQSPYNAGSSSGGTEGGAHVTLDQMGQVTAVWEQDLFVDEIMAVRNRIFINRFDIMQGPDSSAASALTQLEPLTESLEPVFGVNDAGDAIVISQRLFNNSLDVQAHILQQE